MIGYLAGTILEINDKGLTVVVGGVGYRVLVPVHLLQKVKTGEEIELYTSQVVREDAISLYGFSTADERRFFEKVTSISGVGPGIGLRLIGAYQLEELADAIRSNNVAKLQAIPGIGHKTASRIIVDLAQTIEGLFSPTSAVLNQVRDALTQLGYTQKEALEMTASLPSEGSAEELLRQALAQGKK